MIAACLFIGESENPPLSLLELVRLGFYFGIWAPLKSLHMTLYVLYCFMIKTFKCKETCKVYNREFSKKLPQDIQRTAYRKLLMIEASVDIDDLKIPPANRLEKLSGNREGQYSIRINKQYRICFRWENGSTLDVEIVDYH